MLPVLVPLVCMSTLIACCPVRPDGFYTGQAYIRLEKGQTFVAPRKMTLATEAVIQDKDQQIIDLQDAVEKLQRELRVR